ncbi:hypothetical protein [Streptomyces sp. NPDC056921]|uniref:hypothetical protein n=1 Tax=Streptomyces sp. NPDC056921 TaxID=3345966 RepID=UPI00363E67E4
MSLWHLTVSGNISGSPMQFYIAYERVKSSVVDTVRWARRIAAEPTGSPARGKAVQELTAKINRARPYWFQGRSGVLAADRVASAVTEFHEAQGKSIPGV